MDNVTGRRDCGWACRRETSFVIASPLDGFWRNALYIPVGASTVSSRLGHLKTASHLMSTGTLTVGEIRLSSCERAYCFLTPFSISLFWSTSKDAKFPLPMSLRQNNSHKLEAEPPSLERSCVHVLLNTVSFWKLCCLLLANKRVTNYIRMCVR